MDKDIEQILTRYKGKKQSIIMILQDIQDKYNYLPQDVLKSLAKRLDIPLSKIHSIATYYKSFSLKPRGKHLIQVCLGTACHVRGGQRILEEIERELNIRAGETTNDLIFTLETVNCVGACALGPVVVINGNYHGQMRTTKVSKQTC
ncbi:MAG: NAD(P)H-dependent oxidoreductase subunit E [Candidatus Stahlbacteria bacterium]|nr:NAD(P)H-dependent oxidoreductase subunit E [Candidatus Stahlbacteria bacterium]